MLSCAVSRRRYLQCMFKPLQDRILIKRTEATAKTPGGLYIPEAAKEKPIEGEVIAVGPGRHIGETFVEPRVRVGDRVLFSKYAGTEIKVGDVEHMIVREDEILGVLE